MKDSRQLSAIMFTDIEGYTALMQRSEKTAIDFRNQHRKIFETVTHKHHGKIIQYYGDGTLSVFDSAVLAVQCAIEMQSQFLSDSVIPVRIGIHLGDIVITEDDIIGDAVNLASRIESLAIAGSVLVSDKVVEEIKNKNDIQLKSLGKFQFKNDHKLREVYAISSKLLKIPKRSQLRGKTVPKKKTWLQNILYLIIPWLILQLVGFLIFRNDLDIGLFDLIVLILLFGLIGRVIFYFTVRLSFWSKLLIQALNVILALFAVGSFLLNPTRFEPSQFKFLNLINQDQNKIDKQLKSVAVLPFSNFTGDTNQEYLYAGMHDGLISELEKISNLRIAPRTSSRSYSNTIKNLKQIASELNVDAIVEASLTRLDSIIYFKVSLVNVFPEERSLWSHEYSTPINQIPNLYREVTENVAVMVNGVMQPSDQKRLNKTRIANSGAYDAYLRGQYHAGFLNAENLNKARNYFELAIEMDSDFALGYGGISLVWISMKQMGLVSTEEANPIIRKFHNKAMQLDSTNSEMWIGTGAIATWTDYNWAAAEKAFRKSISLNPNQAEGRAAYAHMLLNQNRIKEGREQMDRAVLLDPLNPWVLSFNGVLYLYEGKEISASRQFENLKKLEPNHPLLTYYLLNKYANTFQYDKAIKQLKKVIVVKDEHYVDSLIDLTYLKSDFHNTLKTAASTLEQISKTSYVSPATILRMYEMLHDEDKRMYWLKILHKTKDPNLPYYAVRTKDPIQQRPEYIEIMEDIGLW